MTADTNAVQMIMMEHTPKCLKTSDLQNLKQKNENFVSHSHIYHSQFDSVMYMPKINK